MLDSLTDRRRAPDRSRLVAWTIYTTDSAGIGPVRAAPPGLDRPTPPHQHLDRLRELHPPAQLLELTATAVR